MSPTVEPLDVVLAHDVPSIRAGLHAILAAEGITVVAAVSTMGELDDGMRRCRPQVAIIGCPLPEAGAASAILASALEHGHCAHVLFCRHGNETCLESALGSGAKALLHQDADAHEIPSVVRGVRSGKVVLDSEQLALLLTKNRLDDHGRRTSRDCRPSNLAMFPFPVPCGVDISTLTHRETEVLCRVVLGRRNGEIAAELSISLGTVKSHMSSLLAKLRLRRRAQAIALFVSSAEPLAEVRHA